MSSAGRMLEWAKLCSKSIGLTVVKVLPLYSITGLQVVGRTYYGTDKYLSFGVSVCQTVFWIVDRSCQNVFMLLVSVSGLSQRRTQHLKRSCSS